MQKDRMARIVIVAAIAAGLTGLVVSQFDAPGNKPPTQPASGMTMPMGAAPAEAVDDGIVKPRLTGLARDGKAQFQRNCSVCHGNWAGGTDKGPPLVHQFYNPNHHADMSFVMALRNGVQQHHWKFGNMPPQPQVKFEAAQAIIAFVRAVQAANGIK